MDKIVTGFKATDKNMQCRGFQFEIGVWYKHDGEIFICESGFHFCEFPSGPWSYYSDEGTRIFKVEARGNIIKGEGPGSDLKHVSTEIRLVEEIYSTGNRNTGNGNTGDWNTGDRNTGNGNTGGRNTGDWNTGDRNNGNRNTGNGNTGYWNTGDWNIGNRNTGNGNTGNRNTGNRNTGNGNTGNGNTGDGNSTDNCSGYLCLNEQPIIIFDKKIKHGTDINYSLINELAGLMMKDDDIEDIDRFLSIPNATKEKIKELHQSHIARRKEIRGEK